MYTTRYTNCTTATRSVGMNTHFFILEKKLPKVPSGLSIRANTTSTGGPATTASRDWSWKPGPGRPGWPWRSTSSSRRSESDLFFFKFQAQSQPPTVVCKMEAQLEYVYALNTRFCTFGADLYAQSVLINKISASELSQLRVRCWLGRCSLLMPKKKTQQFLHRSSV